MIYNPRRLLCCVAFLAAILSFGADARAQDDEADPLGEELDNYWSVDRDLPVVEGRLFERDGRFGFGLYGGLMSSEPFFHYIPVGGRLSYFFNNFTGVEVGGQFIGLDGEDPGPLTFETDITRFLRNSKGADFDATTDLEDRFLWRANATLVWNPFYGKWSFLNSKLSHFDFNLVAGGGAVSVSRPTADHSDSSVVTTGEAVLGGGLHFFFNPHWTLRLDGRFYVYQGAETESADTFWKRLQAPAEFLLGVTYLF